VAGDRSRCQVRTDDDCRGSEACREEGRCSARGGACVASGEDCRKAPACAQQGWCTLIDGRCVAGSDADCAASALCSGTLRFCVARHGHCTLAAAHDALCRASEACTDLGRCTAREGACVVASDEDCKRSLECEEHRRCRAHQGLCLANHPDGR